jgi:mRNA interferase RelE/StbE
MYKIKLTRKAKRELKNIKQLYQAAIYSAFEEIKEEPYLGKPLTRELTGRFSYKVGVYRIIYRINEKDKIIQIITAGHRATIYE